MVDIAAVVKEFPGVRPVAGLDRCWIWSAGRFYFALALTAERGHAMQLNCRDVLDLNLVVTVLAFARARTEAVLAAAPFAVLEGFASPSATPFDRVAAVIPAVHRYQEFDHPDLNDITCAVFPAYRCEFSGQETQEEATYRFDHMLDAADLQRPPSPWVRMRFDNPKTGVGSIGPDLGIGSADILMQELRNLNMPTTHSSSSRTSGVKDAACPGQVSCSSPTGTRSAQQKWKTCLPGPTGSSTKESTMRLEIGAC